MRMKRESDRLITQIQRILHEKICDPQLNVTYLAKLLCVSTQHVYQLVYSYYLENPKKVIESCRLARATDLMQQNPGINLCLVAAQSGFRNYKALKRCFKRRLQMSPSDYIKLPIPLRSAIKLDLSKPQINSMGPSRPESRELLVDLKSSKSPRTLISQRLEETS